MTTDEIAAMFARRDQAAARHDVAGMMADLADECVLESPMFGVLKGRAAIEKHFKSLWAAFPDLRFEPQDLVIGSAQVAQTSVASGTDTGGLLQHPPTGKPFRFLMMTLYILKDRQIVYWRRSYDFTGLLLQLATDSAIPADPSDLYSETLDRVQYEQELKTAAHIQRALLPKGQHIGAGFELAAASVPCRAIGGDFFDYFEVSAGTVGFALGDVAGKGPPAALLAAKLQGILSAHAYATGSPADTLTRVNQVLARRPIDARFATVVYGVVSSDGRLTYCNAGHNPPILVEECGPRRLETGGLIIGMFNHVTYEEETLQLQPGDTLVVFSDGVTEALNPEGGEFGDDQLLSCVQASRGLSAAGLLERILATVHEFSAGVPQRDDLTVLVLRFIGADAR